MYQRSPKQFCGISRTTSLRRNLFLFLVCLNPQHLVQGHNLVTSFLQPFDDYWQSRCSLSFILITVHENDIPASDVIQHIAGNMVAVFV